ncbi:MAG TPA: SUMF1/EgtB/PvdO family nonheme iron enzyme [Sedimentisphaerales bacterium]|nr:SUMF1/EgtB/PvdO family nonheme iron enzyme [Sedimentisphaerales bacterium]
MPNEKEYANSIGMKFVRIEPGEFKMGNLTELLPFDMMPRDGGPGNRMDHLRTGDFDEKPVHKVKITKPFFMGVLEVTNFQYELFDADHKKLRGKDETSTDDDEAVVNVNWYDAQAFCRWLSDIEGLPYRLPTEAEWEYACRAGTTSNFYTGERLPKEYQKHQWLIRGPEPVDIHVGATPANPWGLHDMHGNVEEWCCDWYGPYTDDAQTDPVGYSEGDFRVTRGGSHSTYAYYLRSANRAGMMPQGKNWLIGFRVVLGELPDTKPLDPPPPPLNQQNVEQRDPAAALKGPDPKVPYFEGPIPFVVIPPASAGPVFALHNHDPAIVECPNGDLIACWYTCLAEKNRELAQAASRLPYGAKEWQQASPFWDAPDRNDHAPLMWYDDKNTIYHFTGMGFGAGYNNMAVVMRTSTDNGATWSRGRMILPEFKGGHMPVEAAFRMNDGAIAFTSDGNPTLWVSHDEGISWKSCRGAISGNHPGVTQLSDGTLFGLTRNTKVDGMMPIVTSKDMGKTWDYKASEFPPIHGGERLVLFKTREGPLFFASLANKSIEITDASGTKRDVRGLFVAVSEDEGKTWPYKRLVTDDGPGRGVGSMNGYVFTMSQRIGEHLGYFAGCQATNGVIHLISSSQDYAFNLKWAMTPAPAIKYPPMPVKHIVETFDGPELANDGWIRYKSYTGTFDGKGSFRIYNPGRQGGINRAVGYGSFEADFTLKNFRFHPKARSYQGVGLVFEDGLAAKQAVYIHRNGIGPGESPDITFEETPNIIKIKTIWNLDKKQWQVFYGLNGEDAVNELPASKKGIFMQTPFTESVGCAILAQHGGFNVDYFEIKPIDP